MRGTGEGSGSWRSVAAAAVTAGAFATAGALPAAAAGEVTIRIEQLRALDRMDPVGQADFYARVTIDDHVFQTRHIRRADNVMPDWVFSHRTSKRTVNVKLEIFDRNLLRRDDAVDIDRVDNKRDLDFQVQLQGRGRCRVVGFVSPYRCGDPIVRAGRERKSAEIRFTVTSR